MNIYEKLSAIQAEIKAPKNLENKFGGYKYRNCEGICEAFKPFEAKYKVALVIEDEIVVVGDRFYVKAIASLIDCEKPDSKVYASAFARESAEKKGMDASQVTGATSSYARKYALNGLLLLDDTKDPDTEEFAKQTGTESKTAEKAHTRTVNSTADWANQKIEKKHAYVLQKKCDEFGIDPKKYAEQFGIKNVMDMTMGQFRMAMDDIEGKE